MLDTDVVPAKRAIVSKSPTRETEFTEDDYVRFRDLIRMKSGIYFSDRKRNDLKIGVLKAFHYSDFRSLREYYDVLHTEVLNSPLFKTLVSFLTVGETYFFRHFDVIEKVILPTLIKAHQHDKMLRIWSAGCSTGEEPYTVAMVLHRLLPDLREWRICISATDINVNSLQYAKDAVYRPWSLRSINNYYKENYFVKKDGLYYLKEDISSKVEFDYLNLVDDSYPLAENQTKDLDLIFCRNVTIYFEADTTIAVVNRFFNCLKEKAYLAVGHAEPSSLIYDAYVPEIYPDAVIYRKDSTEKKEFHYKTGIRIRSDIFKTYNTKVLKTSKPIAPELSDLQKHIDKLHTEAKSDGAQTKTDIRDKLSKKIEEIELLNRNAADKILKERRNELDETELFSQGLELFQQRQFVDAEKLFQELIGRNPKNGRALYMIAHINANLDQIARAKEYCHRAIEQDALLIEAYYLLGLILKEENIFEDSIKMLKKTIYIDPNFAIGYYDLAVNYFKIGDAIQGRKYLRQTERILKTKKSDERVGILDDLTSRELGMMVMMWEN
jgi:chemotaxis protein methyltransferase CheR